MENKDGKGDLKLHSSVLFPFRCFCAVPTSETPRTEFMAYCGPEPHLKNTSVGNERR